MSKTNRVLNAAFIVMSALVLCKITGYMRSALIPNFIPDRVESDALYFAISISDLMFNLLLGGVMSSALIPFLSGSISQNDEKNAWKSISSYMNATFVAILIVSSLGIIFAPQIIHFFPNKLSPRGIETTIDLTRIMLPSVVFMMLAGIVNGVLYAYKNFVIAAYAPVVYNVFFATSLIIFHNWGVRAVTRGIMCSAFLYFIFQLIFAIKFFRKYHFKIFFQDKGFKKLIFLSLPTLASSSIFQLNIFILNLFALMLRPGSITVYRIASDTWQLPFGIFGLGIASAMLPSLSEKAASGDMEAYKSLFTRAIKTTLMLSIPSFIGYIVLRVNIMSVIYKLSSDTVDIVYSSKVLLFFSTAIITQAFVAVALRGFYAIKDTKTPLYTGIMQIIINIVISLTFIKISENNSFFNDLGASGMAFSYATASFFNACALIVVLNKKVKGINLADMGKHFLKVFTAALIMGVVIYFVNHVAPVNYYNTQFTVKLKIMEVSWMFLEIIIGSLVFAFVVLKLKIREAIILKETILKKLSSIKNKFVKVA